MSWGCPKLAKVISGRSICLARSVASAAGSDLHGRSPGLPQDPLRGKARSPCMATASSKRRRYKTGRGLDGRWVDVLRGGGDGEKVKAVLIGREIQTPSSSLFGSVPGMNIRRLVY
eukprot:182046-Amorphochlora_amoeboformis.AAC.1